VSICVNISEFSDHLRPWRATPPASLIPQLGTTMRSGVKSGMLEIAPELPE
jgi:hypothetical protein